MAQDTTRPRPVRWNRADPSGNGVPGKPLSLDQFYTNDVFAMLVPDDGLTPLRLRRPQSQPVEPVPLPAPPSPRPPAEQLPPPPGTAPPPDRPKPRPPSPEAPFPSLIPPAEITPIPPWTGPPPPFQKLPNFPTPRPRCALEEIRAARELIEHYDELGAQLESPELQFERVPGEHQEAIAKKISGLQQEREKLKLEYA